ncbi:MAG: hypothetical protein KatS3mg131_2672 [Candidatus Tectimicrobiota bacterium]|nr:MAG: hypothetical protein KatS3mg131_2672 [Candidatus Tectomicrobia bacterium]
MGIGERLVLGLVWLALLVLAADAVFNVVQALRHGALD